MRRRRWPLWLFGPEAIVLTSLVFLVDAAALPPSSLCHLGGDPRAGTFDPPGYWLVRKGGAIIVAEPAAQARDGVVYPFVRISYGPSVWAPTNRVLMVNLVAQMDDGEAVSTAENIAIGIQLAEQWQERGDATAARLLRAGGGSASERLPFGYVHDVVAAVLGCWLLVSIGVSIAIAAQRRRARKWRLANCCVSCGYALDGVGGKVCPECGQPL
jgi:hypothetical protein